MNRPYRDRLRILAAGFLVAAAVLLLIGVTLERSRATTDPDRAARAAEHNEQAEQLEAGHDESGERGAAAETTSGAEDLFGVNLFGVNPESTGLIVAAVTVSLLLAVLLLVLARREVLLAVIVVAVGFALLDLGEGLHQAGEARRGLLVIALAAGALHLGAAGFAAVRLRAARQPATAA